MKKLFFLGIAFLFSFLITLMAQTVNPLMYNGERVLGVIQVTPNPTRIQPQIYNGQKVLGNVLISTGPTFTPISTGPTFTPIQTPAWISMLGHITTSDAVLGISSRARPVTAIYPVAVTAIGYSGSNSGSNVVGGVYSDEGGLPYQLLQQGRPIVSVVGVNIISFDKQLVLSPGIYWVVLNSDSGAASFLDGSSGYFDLITIVSGFSYSPTMRELFGAWGAYWNSYNGLMDAWMYVQAPQKPGEPTLVPTATETCNPSLTPMCGNNLSPTPSFTPVPVPRNAYYQNLPPMGWTDWQVLGPGADNETDFLQIADSLVTQGFSSVGYNEMIIDLGWSKYPRTGGDHGQLDSNASWPDGMKYVADYLHERDMKLGLYTFPVTFAANGAVSWAGSLGNEIQDMATYANWGVDYVRYDGGGNYDSAVSICDGIRQSGRPMFFHWNEGLDINVDYPIANSVRLGGDSLPGMSSLSSIITLLNSYSRFSKPNRFNTACEMWLMSGQSDALNKSWFAMYSMMCNSLIFSVDIRTAPSTITSVVKNTDIIAVDQDPLVSAAVSISATQDNYGTVFVKKMSHAIASNYAGPYCPAIAFFNTNSAPETMSIQFDKAGVPPGYYNLRDLQKNFTISPAEGFNNYYSCVVAANATTIFQISPNHLTQY